MARTSKSRGKSGFSGRSGKRTTFKMMGSSPLETEYLSDIKNYATEDYQAGVSYIKDAIAGGASRSEVRKLVRDHNQATAGKKYKKGAQNNALINFDQITRGMERSEVKEKPVTPTPPPVEERTPPPTRDPLWEIFTDSSHEKGLTESSGMDASYENVKASKAGEYEGLTGDALRNAMEKTNLRNKAVDQAEGVLPYKKKMKKKKK